MHVVDHRSGQVEEGASRNVLVESARIAPALVARVLGGWSKRLMPEAASGRSVAPWPI
jgi:enhancing lycopene biosynthesis protein 2